MGWTIKFTMRADKRFSKLDRAVQKRIVKKLSEISVSGNPTASGKALMREFAGLWRYRVGDYRIICSFENSELIVLVIDIDHRSSIYN